MDERRKYARIETHNSVVTIDPTDLPGARQPVAGKVRDISMGGLAFEAERDFEIGQQLVMTLDTPIKAGVKITAEVRHCRRSDSLFVVGVQFINIPETDRALFHPDRLASVLGEFDDNRSL